MMQPKFKVCGLCIRLVDESVMLSESLRDFLLDFLAIYEASIPDKVCSECYHAAFTALKFKENCIKAINKLKKTKICEDLILGKEDYMNSTNEALQNKGKNQEKQLETKDLNSEGNSTFKEPKIPWKREIIDVESDTESVVETTPDVARKTEILQKDSLPSCSGSFNVGCNEKSVNNSRKRTDGNEKNDSRVNILISREENFLANEAIKEGGSINVSNKKRKKRSIPWPSNDPKTMVPKPKHPKVTMETEESDASYATESPFNMKDSYIQFSSNGKALLRPQREYVFSSIDKLSRWEKAHDDRLALRKKSKASKHPERSDENQSLRTRRVSPAPAEKPTKAMQSAEAFTRFQRKPGPKSRVKQANPAAYTASPSRNSRCFYYLNQSGNGEDSLIKVEDASSDDEEIFPSVGPFQCEICQEITNTKKEFVDHIKKLHRRIVDEDVLKSLELDLRKARRKAEKYKMIQSRREFLAAQSQRHKKRHEQAMDVGNHSWKRKKSRHPLAGEIVRDVFSGQQFKVDRHFPFTAATMNPKRNQVAMFGEPRSQNKTLFGLDGEVFEDDTDHDERVAILASAATNEILNGINNSYIAADSDIQHSP